MAHDWVAIDGQVLVEARARKGLSREALGGIVGVVAKTVERYENDGRLPRSLVANFARALDLEIEEIPPRRLEVSSLDSSAVDSDRLARLEEKVDQGFEDVTAILESRTVLLERIERFLSELVERQDAPPRNRTRAS